MIVHPALSSREQFPSHLIIEDANTVAHVWWDGVRLRDTRRRNSWTMNGTVPQIARAVPVPPGAGPFAVANYYALGSGSDVLDFAGDFSACFVLTPTGAGGENVFRNGVLNTSGYWFIKDAGAWRLYAFDPAVKSVVSAGAGHYVNDAINVVCIGRSGTTIVIKSNLRTYVTTPVAGIVPGVTSPARIGDAGDGRASFSGTIHEAWFSTTTPSDALFTAIMTRVKARLGITAW